MRGVFLLLAIVATFTIVYCDDNADSSNDDFDDFNSSYTSIQSSSKKSQSSSSSSSASSSSSLLLTPASKSLKSSKSSSAQSSASSLESSSTKINDYTSKKQLPIDSDDDANSSSCDTSGAAEVDTTVQGSTDANTSDSSLDQSVDNKSAGAYAPAYKCGPNQVFSNCTNGGCDARNCSQAGKPVPCVKLDPKNCIKGCVCQSGYLRTKKGNCVLKNQCNEGCGNDPNAHPGCGVNCGRTCATYKNKNVACPAICKVGGCDCNDGYVYDGIAGKCVLPGDCSGCGGDPNAEPGCGYNCGSTCSSYKINKDLCPRLECTPDKCDCKDGYVLDENIKKCVLIKDCSPICGLNEVYSSCINGGCGYKNCSQLGQPELCVDPIPGGCIKGCLCAKGYLRAPNGTCIPQDQCPKTGGCGGDPNAQPGCGYNCGKTCSTYKINRQLLCPRIVCKPDKCDCKDGYVLDKNVNKCVLIKDCTPTCGANEIYSSCTNGGCGYQNCSQIGQPQICIDRTPESCTKGCICASGYLRACNGTCVPQDQCPPTSCNGDPNAHPGCGVNCGKTCDTYKTKPVACPLICNLNGCDCNEGYVLDSVVKKCVLPKDCTKKEKCDKPNEVYDVCPAPCPPRRCDVDDRLIRCAAPPKPGDPSCQPGCRCADGFARNATGTCVSRDQCEQPLTCNGPNEVYDSCPAPCPGDSCDVNPAVVLCLPGPKYGDPACKPACICIDGYARNANNECVPRDQCPTSTNTTTTTPPTGDQCPGQNEFFDSCIHGCDTQACADIGKIFLCPFQPVCQSGCRCNPGFYRTADNVCVLESECPPSTNTTTTTPPTDDQCPGQNEFFDTCISGCSNQSCSTIGQIFHCPLQPAVCRTGCRCKQGFYRAADDVCIPESECPPSTNTTTTTPPTDDQCPGQNEFFDTCISGCSNQSCSTIGQIFNCPLQPAVCRTGCRCKQGFYRDADNFCVAESQCPTPPCPEGEVYSRCPTVKCDADYCPKTRNSSLTCPTGIVCDKPRCVCGFNSHRDRKTGKCIATANCPPFKCDGPNEVYKACPASCPGEDCSDYINSTKCPPFRIGIVVPCRPQCKCKDGYYRNAAGTCILGSECGPKAPTKPPVINTTPVAPITTTVPTTTTNGNNNGDSGNALTNLKAGITKFNGEFLYDRMIASKGQNIIASPYSVLNPMAQLALAATGESLKQLLSILNVPDQQSIRSAYPTLTSSLDGQTSVNFTTACIMYSNDQYPLRESFKEDSAKVVHAEAQNIDFSQNVQAAATINAWVENKTNNKIKDLISPSDLSSLTRLVLVNAIYFKGEWEKQFKQVNTKEADFYLSDGTTKKTKLMNQQATFNYGEVPKLNLTVLEMFYKGRNFSMVIVLPNAKDGVYQTGENLQNPDNLNTVMKSLSSQTVNVYIPTFEINTETDLTGILKQEGVTKIFDTKDSGLSGILKKPEQVYVSKAIQKAYIKVDETGSEAAAANGVVVSTRSLPKPPVETVVFRADHAFLFYIKLHTTTVFCGAIVQ